MARWRNYEVRIVHVMENGDLLIQYRDERGETRARIVKKDEVR